MTRRRKTLLVVLAVILLAAGGFAWYWQATAVDRAVDRQISAMLLADARKVESLIAALKDEDEFVRSNAAEALGKLPDPRGIEPLIAALKDRNLYVRLFAAQALGRLGDPRGVEFLIAALKDEDWRVRRCAAQVLGKLGDPRGVEPLIAVLKDENWWVRNSAAAALGKLGDRRAVEPLIAALKNWNELVRLNAALTLGKLGDPRAVEPLIAALKDEDEDVAVRRFAALALGQLGDARAVGPLEELLGDENADVREAAKAALEKLRAGGTSTEGTAKRAAADPRPVKRYALTEVFLAAGSPEGAENPLHSLEIQGKETEPQPDEGTTATKPGDVADERIYAAMRKAQVTKHRALVAKQLGVTDRVKIELFRLCLGLSVVGSDMFSMSRDEYVQALKGAARVVRLLESTGVYIDLAFAIRIRTELKVWVGARIVSLHEALPEEGRFLLESCLAKESARRLLEVLPKLYPQYEKQFSELSGPLSSRDMCAIYWLADGQEDWPSHKPIRAWSHRILAEEAVTKEPSLKAVASLFLEDETMRLMLECVVDLSPHVREFPATRQALEAIAAKHVRCVKEKDDIPGMGMSFGPREAWIFWQAASEWAKDAAEDHRAAQGKPE